MIGVAGCSEGKPPDHITLSSLGALCRGDGGEWSERLVACACPSGRVFQIGRGCRRAHEDESALAGRPFTVPAEGALLMKVAPVERVSFGRVWEMQFTTLEMRSVTSPRPAPWDRGACVTATGDAGLCAAWDETWRANLPLVVRPEPKGSVFSNRVTAAGYRARWEVRLAHWAAVRRSLTVWKDGAKLTALVSPDGGIDVFRLVTEGRWDETTRTWDGRFGPVEERTRRRADPVAVAEALARDRVRPTARAVMIDTGVDATWPELWGRIDPQGAVLDDESRHGTEMASILTEDLPGLLLTAIRAEESDDPRLRDSWIETIRRASPRVVNISYDFELMDCGAFWDPIFRAFPNTTFVVAAGNTGTENPDTCPARLGGAHANVVTVAGLDEHGRIHRESSYGRRVAKTSAPFTATCLRDQKCAGTSVAAALVSNGLLR